MNFQNIKEFFSKDTLTKAKTYYTEMPKKKKTFLFAVVAGIVILAALGTFYLNENSAQYEVLYGNLTPTESAEIYQSLLMAGASPERNELGEILVPANEVDIWLLYLASEGYPQSPLAYDTYGQNAGMTATESDREMWDTFQTQDRIQQILSRMSGVVSAAVTITVPESTGYVWEQAEGTVRPTAGVLLTLSGGTTLSPAQVTTIKNLVAASVINMLPEDVTVVDAATSLELHGATVETAGVQDENGLTFEQNLEFEEVVQSRIEDNIEKLLTPRYGDGGVVATAKVTINYDSMMTEQLELLETPADENGDQEGFATHTQGAYGVNGAEIPVEGIVGEELNTDVPDYSYVNPDPDGDTAYYTWSTDFDYSYIKTQIERGNALLERATVSVLVNDENFTAARREELTSLISTSVDIPPELIFVSEYYPDETPPEEETPVDVGPLIFGFPWWIFAIAGVSLLVIIIIVFILMRRSKKKAEERAEQAILEAQLAEQAALEAAQNEIDDYKKQLANAALADANPKEDAIMNEVRDFAKANPEITASLLRSWMREGDD